MVGVSQGKCKLGKWPHMRHRFVTNADLAKLIVEVAKRLPPDVSRIVGIPRSGLMAASFLAAHLHLPLYSIVDSSLRSVGGGSRMSEHVELPGRTLVVDDTVTSGRTWLRVKQAIPSADSPLLLAMYCTPDKGHIPDIVGEFLPLPHLLEWNLFSCGYMSIAGLDLDGVICEDNDGDEDPAPLYLPRHQRVRAIITARPESWREVTRSWLTRWNVLYDELVMWPSREEDRTLDAVADFKVAAMQATGCVFYVESGPGLSHAMRERGARVLCPDEGWLR
jgi:hypothetical protein